MTRGAVAAVLLAIVACDVSEVVDDGPSLAGDPPQTWRRIGGSTRCGALLAPPEILAAMQTEWADCGDGCRFAAPSSGGTTIVVGHEPVRRVEGTPHLVSMRIEGDGSETTWTQTVTPLGGPPVFALRHRMQADDACSTRVAIGDGGIAVAMHRTGVAQDELVVIDPARETTVELTLGDTVQGLAVGRTGAWVDGDVDGLRREGAETSVRASGWVHPRVVGDAAIVRGADGHTLGRVTDGDVATWHRSERTIAEVTLDRARARVLWVEADEDETGFTDARLWSADLTGEAIASLGAVPDTSARGAWGMVADDGRALSVDGETAYVLDLDGGKRFAVPSPAGLRWQRPLWIDADEAWLLAAPEGAAPRAAATIVRQRWRR
jgi:hypothetical protein